MRTCSRASPLVRLSWHKRPGRNNNLRARKGERKNTPPASLCTKLRTAFGHECAGAGVSDVALSRGAEYKKRCTPVSNYGHSRLVNACIHFGTIKPSSFSELVHPLSEEMLVLATVMSALRRDQCSLAQNSLGAPCSTRSQLAGLSLSMQRVLSCTQQHGYGLSCCSWHAHKQSMRRCHLLRDVPPSTCSRIQQHCQSTLREDAKLDLWGTNTVPSREYGSVSCRSSAGDD